MVVTGIMRLCSLWVKYVYSVLHSVIRQISPLVAKGAVTSQDLPPYPLYVRRLKRLL